MFKSIRYTGLSLSLAAAFCFCAGTVRADDGAKAEKRLKHRGKRFKKIDVNGDGGVTLDELIAFRTGHPHKHAGKNAAKHAANASTRIQKHFNKVDANSDAKITLEEFVAFRNAHPHKHGKKHDKEATK
jgi:hypothetical protein